VHPAKEADAQALSAAVDDAVRDRLMALRHVERLQNKNIYRVFHPAALVLRCFDEIDDVLVVLGLGINLAEALPASFS